MMNHYYFPRGQSTNAIGDDGLVALAK